MYLQIRENNISIPTLLVPRILHQTPSHFCLFAVSNPMCTVRNNFFTVLTAYKKVDSCGKHWNNMGHRCPGTHSGTELYRFIAQYKFSLCFENSSSHNYLTEKLLNAYTCGSIPIYWGCPNVSDYINMECMLYLKPNHTDDDVAKLIQEITALDTNPQLYKNKYEQCFFKNGILPDEFNMANLQRRMSAL